MARIPQLIKRNPLSQVAPQAAPAGQGWAALADLAQTAADFVKPAAEGQAREEGEKSVYRDAQGNLKVDERSLYSGEMGALQNQAAYAKYLSQKSIDINSTMSELAVKYEFDPGGFKDATDAYTKTLRDDPNVPNVLKEDVVRSVEEGASRQFNGLHRAEIDRTYKAADTQSATLRDMLMEDYVSLTMQGDEEGAAAKWKEIEEISRMRGVAPYINETPAETEAYKRGVRGTAKAAKLLKDLTDLEGADEISDEQRSELTTLLKDPDISPKARQSLYAATQGRLKSIDAAGIVKGLTNDSFEGKVARLSRSAVGGAQRPDSFTGMNDQFSSGLDAMIAAAPESVQKNLKVSSGFRSVARQKELWEGALKKYGSAAVARKWVAPPGNSEHGHGNAADLKFQSDEAKQWVHANAGQFGLSFPLSNEPWHIELATARGGGGGVTPKQRTANQTALTDAGLQVSDANEFLALTFGADKAVAMLNGDDPMALAEIPEDVLAANPELKGKTVREVQNWANRKMTVKSTDLANMAAQIDSMDLDPETRKLAIQGLNEKITVRQNIEAAAANIYDERLATGDVSLTEQQIREDQDLSTEDQVRLTGALDKVNKQTDDLMATVQRINTPGATFNSMDKKDVNAVGDVFNAAAGDAAPTSPEFIGAAASITKKTGIIPPKVGDSIRSAVRSDDPIVLSQALEMLGQLKDLAGGDLSSVTGSKGLENLLSDYKLLGQFGSGEEAATQMIKNREKKPKNITDEAKEAVKKLNISDVVNSFDKSFFSDPKIGDSRAGASSIDLLTDGQENEMMAEYSRLFKDDFMETGDFEISQNRALDKMGRIYGINEVSGVGRIMKFPPQKTYPPVAGSHDWMSEQLVDEVNAEMFGDDVTPPGAGVMGALNAAAPNGPNSNWLKGNQIALWSDEVTAREAKTGKPTSYIVYAMRDGVLERLPKRFSFDPSSAKIAARTAFEEKRSDMKAAQAVRDERVSTQQELTGGILDRFDEE
tara:strand:- start:13522 stop:16506 length:2985 start_codon:yes stop_codon:yes gene_type:complete